MSTYEKEANVRLAIPPGVTLDAHAWTRYKEGDNIWTDIQYILSGLKNICLRMSSHYKRVEIKDILNPLTTESNESTNSQKRANEALHSRTAKLAISFPSGFDWYWSHLLLSPAVRPSDSAPTSKVHYCPMNNCSEDQPTRRKLDTHFLKTHMPDTGPQSGTSGITTSAKEKKLCRWMSGFHWGYYFDECLQWKCLIALLQSLEDWLIGSLDLSTPSKGLVQ